MNYRRTCKGYRLLKVRVATEVASYVTVLLRFSVWSRRNRRFSLQEWGASRPHPFIGAYKLEHDQSWTPFDDIAKREEENDLFDKIMNARLAVTDGSGQKTEPAKPVIEEVRDWGPRKWNWLVFSCFCGGDILLVQAFLDSSLQNSCHGEWNCETGGFPRHSC